MRRGIKGPHESVDAEYSDAIERGSSTRRPGSPCQGAQSSRRWMNQRERVCGCENTLSTVTPAATPASPVARQSPSRARATLPSSTPSIEGARTYVPSASTGASRFPLLFPTALLQEEKMPATRPARWL